MSDENNAPNERAYDSAVDFFAMVYNGVLMEGQTRPLPAIEVAAAALWTIGYGLSVLADNLVTRENR